MSLSTQQQQQQDPFYQSLPFTLQCDQLNPDFIVLGTGLQQSAIAAYLSKMQQKRGLILDIQKTYGSCLKTVSLKQLNELVNKKNHQKLYQFYIPKSYENINKNFINQTLQKKSFRGYNIDIQPCLFFGNSITCQCLKQADMDKYMDFRLVNHLLQYQNHKLTEVPLSKGKIFETKSLGLIEKKLLLTKLHTLMKIYHKFMNIQQDHNSTKQFDKGFGQVSQQLYKQFQSNLNNYFLPFLQKITKKNKKITNYLAYIICNYQYNYNKPIPLHMSQSYKLKSFIQKFGKFIMSCGIYGQGPYLYVDNGVGDIPQAFSRISSIFGSTYILHPKLQIYSIQLQKIEENNHQQIIIMKSNIAPNEQIKTKKVFYGETFTKLYMQTNKNQKVQIYTQKVLRVLILCKKLNNQQECPSLGYFLDLQENLFINPVYLFMFDDSTHTCPVGFIVYQFQTIISKQISQDQQKISQLSQNLINKLSQIRGNQFNESIVFLTNYIRSRQFSINKSNERQQQNLLQQKQILLEDTFGLDLDRHFQNFISIVGKKDNYFKKKNIYQQEFQQDYQEDYGTNNILEKLENIDIHKNGIKQQKLNQKQNEQDQIYLNKNQIKQKEDQNHTEQQNHARQDQTQINKQNTQINEQQLQNNQEDTKEKIQNDQQCQQISE